jgi:hypothetical protein
MNCKIKIGFFILSLLSDVYYVIVAILSPAGWAEPVLIVPYPNEIDRIEPELECSFRQFVG